MGPIAGRPQRLEPLERMPSRLVPGGVRRVARRAPSIDPRLFLAAPDPRVGGLGLLPGRLGAAPVPAQDPARLPCGVDDVQAVFQDRPPRRSLRVAKFGDTCASASRDPLGASETTISRLDKARPASSTSGLAVDCVAAEDGRQTRRLDPDQRRSPPKEISSTARVRPGGPRRRRGPPARPLRVGPRPEAGDSTSSDREPLPRARGDRADPRPAAG